MKLWTIDPDEARYVTAQVQKSEIGGDIWAGYATHGRRLLGVAEGISRDVVLRLLRRKVEAGGVPTVAEKWSYFNNVRRTKRLIGLGAASDASGGKTPSLSPRPERHDPRPGQPSKISKEKRNDKRRT